MHEGACARAVIGRARVALAAALLVVPLAPVAADAGGRAKQRAAAAAALAARPSRGASSPPQRAPGGPPLVSGSGSLGGGAEPSEAGGAEPGEVDPLVGNGLGSPLCRGVLGETELSRTNRRDCETSGFVAGAAPSGDYGLDVHINTGLLGLSHGGLLAIVQDLFIQPVWMAIVWAVHALIVMLEWGFTIDLLDSPGVRESVGAGLQRMQRAVTAPWLSLAFACASILAVYNGLIRRRVAETLGQSLLLLVMVAGGMWVTLDPAGTVGALGGWANEASLGTLATVARGAPARGGNALATSMSDVFAAAVEVPWCYLEFGDVSWCRDPTRLDPELHAAALRMAHEELASAGCKSQGDATTACAAGSTRARGLVHSAQLLREARSNGAIFLALPANGPQRNSINDSGSLLRVICRSSDATACHGPMAAAAEFRTDGGTWPRVGGLLLIAAGLSGMLLMLGFIAARLLAAALFSLFYLLLAPAAVLAPAFGEGGRRLFGRWATQLLAAVVSKLLFSFLLGVMLAVVAVLSALSGLGFWTQWLLMSVFWWGSFARREHVLALVGGGTAPRRAGSSALARRLRRAGGRGGGVDRVRTAMRRLGGSAPTGDDRRRLAAAVRQRGRLSASDQVARSLDADQGSARAAALAAPAARERVAGLNAQLERVRSARGRASAGGDSRRAAELAHRAARVEHEITAERRRLDEATHARHHRESARGGSDLPERAAFLDAQSELPGSRHLVRRRSGERRDYPALAGLIGYTRGEYDALSPPRQRAARLELDRELALRREINATVRDVVRDSEARGVRRRDALRAERDFERGLERRLGDAGQSMPASRDRSPIARWRASGRVPGGRGEAGSSRVMDDARAVAERRKRQLGFGRD